MTTTQRRLPDWLIHRRRSCLSLRLAPLWNFDKKLAAGIRSQKSNRQLTSDLPLPPDRAARAVSGRGWLQKV
jgi:hypothetical protein